MVVFGVQLGQTKQAPRLPGSQLRPLQVTWELTRRCEWKPAHRGQWRGQRASLGVFTTAEAFHLVDEVSKMHVPLLALSGGDPLLRPDLFPIIEFASRRSVRTSLTLLPTSMLDDSVIRELKDCGLMRASFWLHGSTATLHDKLSGDLPDLTGAPRTDLGCVMKSSFRYRSTRSSPAVTWKMSMAWSSF